jgi:hypothetical protein
MGSFSRILFLCLGFTWGLGAAAQTPTPAAPPPVRPTLRIPRVTRAPKLEDFLNGAPREAEATITDFRQRTPGDGVPASDLTTAYLSYDEKNLYIVWVCKEPPEKLRARLAKREDIGSDDEVAIYIDTFHDGHRAYAFATNPLGVQLDAIFTEGQGNDFSFDTLWYSQGRLTADGFVVWMAIPFKSLRFSGEPVQHWGIALDRVTPKTNEVDFWPVVTQRIAGFVQQFATLEGLERISPGRNIQFIPYGQFARARFLDTTDPNNPEFRIDNEVRGGLDAKFVLRDALTLDVTANPDFSQVESDEPQVTINQRFEVFFPERRPFFIENAGFFQTPIPLFFSRRIAEPQFGTRLTGKVGRWVLGGLVIDDRGPGRGRLASDPLSGERAGIGVVHVQREFGGTQSKIGFFVSSRDFASSSNRVFAVDTRIQLTPNWVLEAQAMRSYTTQLPDEQQCQKAGRRLSGPAYYAELSHTGRHFFYAGRYNDRSPDFCSELGFVPRVDIRDTEQFAGYFWRPKHSRVVSFGPSVFTLVNWNRAGQVQDWFVDSKFDVTLTGQTDLFLRRVEQFELFQGIGFRKHLTEAGVSTEWLRWLSVSADYRVGTNENFFPASGLPPFLGNSTGASAGFTIRPSPRIRFDQTYIFSRLTTREGVPPGFAGSSNVFNNHILRSKLNYQFTRELSVRAILDYNSTLANPDVLDVQTNLGGFVSGPTQPTKKLTADFLVTYLLHPGTAVYVGYTDRYANLMLDPGAPPSVPPMLNRIASPTTSTGRQFFVKMSYLFRF